MTLSGSLSATDRYKMALRSGFNAGQAFVMVAISYLECGNCDMSSVNGSGDVGLMQINRQHWNAYGGELSLTDPQNSMNAAHDLFVSVGGNANPERGFKQWCTYPGGCGADQGAVVPNQISRSDFNSLLTKLAGEINGGGGPGNFDPTPPDDPIGSPTPPGTPRTPGEANPCAYIDKQCDGLQMKAGPIDLSQLAVSLCNIGNTFGHIGEVSCEFGQILKWFTARGHWWEIALIAVGVAMIIFGINIYFAPEQIAALGKLGKVV